MPFTNLVVSYKQTLHAILSAILFPTNRSRFKYKARGGMIKLHKIEGWIYK